MQWKATYFNGEEENENGTEWYQLKSINFPGKEKKNPLEKDLLVLNSEIISSEICSSVHGNRIIRTPYKTIH